MNVTDRVVCGLCAALLGSCAVFAGHPVLSWVGAAALYGGLICAGKALVLWRLDRARGGDR